MDIEEGRKNQIKRLQTCSFESLLNHLSEAAQEHSEGYFTVHTDEWEGYQVVLGTATAAELYGTAWHKTLREAVIYATGEGLAERQCDSCGDFIPYGTGEREEGDGMMCDTCLNRLEEALAKD